jgi:hypothetical protein
VLAAVVALSDPEVIVIGGSWGTYPVILDVITAAFTVMPRHVAVRFYSSYGIPSALAPWVGSRA